MFRPFQAMYSVFLKNVNDQLISNNVNKQLTFQINYKASLLHLQPRQMRLEIMDLKEESSDALDEFAEPDDLGSWLEDDQRSEDSEQLSTGRGSRAGSASGGMHANMFLSDDEDDSDKGTKDIH